MAALLLLSTLAAAEPKPADRLRVTSDLMSVYPDKNYSEFIGHVAQSGILGIRVPQCDKPHHTIARKCKRGAHHKHNGLCHNVRNALETVKRRPEAYEKQEYHNAKRYPDLT